MRINILLEGLLLKKFNFGIGMFSIKCYYQILDLQASNDNLLFLYREILQSQLEEEINSKEYLRDKIRMREEIQQELRNCIQINFISKQARIISRICSHTFPFFVEAKYKSKIVFRQPSWDLCLNLEMKNIRNYYRILFDQRYSKSVTNLLLDQKSRVETCKIQERN